MNPKPVLSDRQKINNFVLRGGLLIVLGAAIAFMNGQSGAPIALALVGIGIVYLALAAMVWWRRR